MLIKKRQVIFLARDQMVQLAVRAARAPLPASTREARWSPPAGTRWLWAPAAVAEAGMVAFDLLPPLVDLRQDQRCAIETDQPILYCIAGLVVLPLLIATVSGLAKRD